MKRPNSYQRRAFLSCVGQTAVVGAFASQAYAGQHGALSHDDFAKHLGERFQVTIDDQTWDVKLTETELGTSKMPGANRDPFMVVFHGPKNLSFEQESYQVYHPRLGRMKLFLTPTGLKDPARSTELQAVFN